MDEARTFSAEQRKKLAQQGKALSDGSYPIVTKADLRNAIQAYGRASNKAAAKRHIIKRARALGATNLLPDTWDAAQEEAATKLYYFEGRNTPIAASSVTEARKKKKRGGDKLVKVRTPTAAERKTMQKGRWVRTRKDGKSPAKSQYGKGRGHGPPRDKASEEKVMSEIAAESFQDTMSLLRRSVREELGRRAYLVDASSEWLVYERYDEDMGEYRLYRRSYSMGDGSVSLEDDATEVLRTTVYVPAAKQESAAGLVGIWGASLATDYANALGQTKTFNSVKGTPRSDLGHAFTQDEGSNPVWCSTCGRNKRNPIHGGDEGGSPATPHRVPESNGGGEED